MKSFFKQLPKLLFVAVCQYSALGKIYGNNALVEPALELVIAVFVLPGGQERAAAHGREHVALVIFTHLLSRNVVGIEALGGALYRKTGKIVVLAAFQAVVFVQNVYELGERGRNVNAFFIFDALVTLF